MATFIVTITTPSRRRPKGAGPSDVTERGRIQECLLQVVQAVSNCSAYDGVATGPMGGQAEFGYHDDE